MADDDIRRHVGILVVDFTLLAVALGLPEGTVIERTQDDLLTDRLNLRVHHPGIPASIYRHQAPEVQAIFKVADNEDGTEFVEWKVLDG